MPDAKLYLSQVNIGEKQYFIKDAELRKTVADLRAAGLEIKVEPTIVGLNAKDYRGKLVLVPEEGSETGTYVEYVAYDAGGEDWKFERIGTTAADLTDYLKVNSTISIETVDSATVDAATAGEYNLAGQTTVDVPTAINSFTVPTVTQVAVNKGTGATVKYSKPATFSVVGEKAVNGKPGNYTPVGKVTLPKLSASVPANTQEYDVMATAGTAYKLTGGGVAHANDTKGEAVNASVSGEILTLTKVEPITAVGTIGYQAPVLSGALPTFKKVTLATGNGAATVNYTEEDSTKILNLAGEAAHLSAAVATWDDQAEANVTDATYKASITPGTETINPTFANEKVQAAATGGTITVEGGNKNVALTKTTKKITIDQAAK